MCLWILPYLWIMEPNIIYRINHELCCCKFVVVLYRCCGYQIWVWHKFMVHGWVQIQSSSLLPFLFLSPPVLIPLFLFFSSLDQTHPLTLPPFPASILKPQWPPLCSTCYFSCMSPWMFGSIRAGCVIELGSNGKYKLAFYLLNPSGGDLGR